MNVLVLGAGGREHALGWKMRQSPLADEVYFAPGNAGTATQGQNVALDPSDHDTLITFCRERRIDLVVVGSDRYLAEGVIDVLAAADISAFGPTKAAAEIEWSKAFAKRLMAEKRIPTAMSASFSDFDAASRYVRTHELPVVIKASGLAGGKGVVIANSREAAEQALREIMVDKIFDDAGCEVVIEEFLRGTEISIHALCVGESAILFPPAQDHKRAFDNDDGPNTGGMGAVAPIPAVSAVAMHEIHERIILPTLRGLAEQGRAFSGLLYPSVMLTDDGPKVIEFNARFGDPEAEAYMRLLESDLLPALVAVAKGSLDVQLKWNSGAVACVIMASGGYPNAYQKGKYITGIEEAERDGAIVFHAGTALNAPGKLFTSGGRVLAVTAVAQTLQEALSSAYQAVEKIHFDGAHYRRDIGAKAIR